jgi:acetoin utilization protein AcuB
MSKVTHIEDKMTLYPTLTTRTTTVTEAWELMIRSGIRHLPVVERGKVVGLISERDLRQAQMLADAMHMIVADVMATEPYCVEIGTPLATVVGVMASKKLGSAVIVNKIGHVVGIFTSTDATRVLGELLREHDKCGISTLVVEEVLSLERGVDSR